MLKTLDEFLADPTVNLYPSDVDEATKTLIQQWFGYRRVANNRMFPNWMFRIMNRDYPRYQELLRIEARTAGSEYDWLVTNYEERQVEITNRDTSSSQGTVTANKSHARTFVAGTTETVTDVDTLRKTGTNTMAHTGTEGNLLTRNLTSSTSGTDGIEETTEGESTRTPNLTTENKGSNNRTDRHGVISRQAPMDADLSGNSASLNANVNHVVGESGVDTGVGEVANDSHFMAGFPNLAIQNPTATSDELTDASSVDYNTSSQSGTEQTSSEGSKTTEGSHSEQTTDTGTENNARTVNLSDSETLNETDTRNLTSQRVRGGTDTDTTTITGTDTKSDSGSATHNGLERTIFTGRGGQSPQFLLDEAVKFIKETSAWKWLYQQIDSCFMMLYDIDEYEED